MIPVSWNFRGLGQASVGRTPKAIIRMYNPDCVYLMETKLKANQTSTIVNRFVFDLFVAVPPIGSREGLLFLWCPNVPVNILGFNQCMISMVLYSTVPHQAFVLTLVYGPSQYNGKESFWDSMVALATSYSDGKEPWLIIGILIR